MEKQRKKRGPTKRKIIKPVHYRGLTPEQMVKMLDEEHPIQLQDPSILALVDRVYDRYPLINKAEIKIIIKAFFKTFRELLVIGKVVSLKPLFGWVKLLIFTRKRTTMKVKIDPKHDWREVQFPTEEPE